MNDETLYYFIIDTDSYAGNFERQMCAYITGQLGECGVGQNYSNKFFEEVEDFDFGESISNIPDDKGCSRPVSIYESSPSRCDYHSLVIFFNEEPTKRQVEVLKERAIKFSLLGASDFDKWKKPFKIIGFRILKRVVSLKELYNEAL